MGQKTSNLGSEATTPTILSLLDHRSWIKPQIFLINKTSKKHVKPHEKA
jgi:hypothetical protein